MAKDVSNATVQFERMLSEASSRAVLEDYFNEQFELTAAMAAAPDNTQDARATYCGQMAVWLKLKRLAKG